MTVIERFLSVGGGLLMIYPGHVTDAVGLVIVAIIVVIQILERRNDKKKLQNT